MKPVRPNCKRPQVVPRRPGSGGSHIHSAGAGAGSPTQAQWHVGRTVTRRTRTRSRAVRERRTRTPDSEERKPEFCGLPVARCAVCTVPHRESASRRQADRRRRRDIHWHPKSAGRALSLRLAPAKKPNPRLGLPLYYVKALARPAIVPQAAEWLPVGQWWDVRPCRRLELLALTRRQRPLAED